MTDTYCLLVTTMPTSWPATAYVFQLFVTSHRICLSPFSTVKADSHAILQVSRSMAIDLPFRRKAVRTLTNEIGCYVLCDLDGVPIYVGQSVDGIRSRVHRHLTSEP